MIPRIAVYTCVTGAYVPLLPHPVDDGVDWIVFTDTPEKRTDWQVRGMPPAGDFPRLVAKYYKFMPHLVLPEYEYTIWIDGSVNVTAPRFAMDLLESADAARIAMWRHPYRDCIYEEAAESLTQAKYCNQPIRAQAQFYQQIGHPEHWGLWAAGVIARRRDFGQSAELGEMWLNEVYRWSSQDQLSLPVCLRRLGLAPAELPHTIYNNPWLTITSHNPNV